MYSALKFTYMSRITVDLKFRSWISNGSVALFFDSNLLFWWNPYGFTGLQRWIHVVNPKILHCFEKRLGFHSFWTGPFEFARIHVDSVSLMFTRMREVGSCDFYLVSFGDLDLNLQNFWLWFCFFLLVLAWNPNETVNLLLLICRFKTFECPFFFSISGLCDRAWVCHYQWWIRTGIVEKTIQWWRFNAESLRIIANSIEFCW